MTDRTGTVKAEDAPLGVLLWPVTRPEAEPNFTLASVTRVSRLDRTTIVWEYQSGKTRTFAPGEDVVVSAEAAEHRGHVYLVRSESGNVLQVYAWPNDLAAAQGAYCNDGFYVLRWEDPTDAERAEYGDDDDPVRKVLVVA